ncbi:ASCH domain-containing protein [Halobacillus sp. SY10]|uniref:ASCH domain-containing protein n=1 Tax=Halobacillus aidingensis TaxID=240303 RepID=A0A1H0LSU9_HALAD|nr:ASCH domain-containing protein [Halobacillus aidingensis]SDO71204.1 ASCH domain-containing protein [Halobacillus aidingensis]
MKGLLVKEPWIDLILSGEKTWEIRGTNTKHRGTTGLIKSGTGHVFGTVEIVDSQPLTKAEYERSTSLHGIPEENCQQLPYKRTYAWVLRNPFFYEEPIPYTHPLGAVIWVDLDKAMKAEV